MRNRTPSKSRRLPFFWITLIAAISTTVASAKAETVTDEGFDAAASYTVGLLTDDLGPAGLAISNRKKSSVKRMALKGDGAKAAATLPTDVLYIRAGSISPNDVLKSPIFKQAVAQNKGILVEREAIGRTAYEHLLLNVFNFAPLGTNALLLRSDGDNNESWEAFVVEQDEFSAGNGEDDTSADKANGRLATKPAEGNSYKIDLNAIASVLKGKEISNVSKAGTAGGLSMAAPQSKTAVKPIIWGRYLIAQVTHPKTGAAWVVNPHAGYKWERQADICSRTPCGGYGSTAVSYTVRDVNMTDIVWWDAWVYCGETGPIDKNVRCDTGYKKSLKKISGYTEKVGTELGVSLTTEGEVGIPFVAKAKTSVSVNAKGTYSKTFYHQTETTYETSYNIRIRGGYQARFGRGNWSATVGKWLTGRHERTRPVGPPATLDVSMWIDDSWSDQPHGCVNLDYRWREDVGDETRKFYRVSCPSTWNPNYQVRARLQRMKTFGVMKWAICKQNDVKCKNKYQSNDMESLERAFPL